MFQLHERTRRRVAVALFLLLAVLPTLAVLAYGLWRHLPGAARRQAARLSERLGLDVSLDSVGHPWPGVIVYDGLRLADPETGRLLLKCDRVKFRHRKPDEGKSTDARELVIAAGRATLNVADVEWIRDLAEKSMRRRPDGPKGNLHFAVEELTLGNTDEPWTLASVEGKLQSAAARTTIELGFLPAGAEGVAPVRVALDRDRQSDPAAYELTIDTAGHEIPCRLAALGAASLADLGPHARFQGRAMGKTSADGWHSRLSGQLLGVDLQTLTADRVAHHLAGTAEVTLQSAEFCNGRLVHVAGHVSIAGGAVGKSFLEAVSRWLGMAAPASDQPTEDPVPLERLSLGFALGEDGLRLHGECPGGEGVVAVGRHGPLLTTPADHPVHPLAIAAALALPGDLQLPLTTAWLAERLPSRAPAR